MMTTNEIEEARAFLAGCEGVELGKSYRLLIGKTTYEAVRYDQTRETLPGCPAYARGERTHTLRVLYVLGQLPTSYRRNPGSVNTNALQYQIEGGGLVGDWYVAGHSTEESQRLAAERGQFARPHFLLMRAMHAPIGAQSYLQVFAEVLSKLPHDRDGMLSHFAWPGGYPIVYHAADGGTLCATCANGGNDSDASEHADDKQWRIECGDAYYEGPPLVCDHCNEEIESAYGDPDADEEDKGD